MQPGKFNPSGEDAWVRRVQNLERKVQELAAANPFGAMGIKPMPDGLIVEGYETVNGPLEVNGDSEFNGSLSINGPLHLQPGSIENDSLTDPLVVSTSGVSQNNFSLSPSVAIYAGGTVTVPAGYTKASVLCMVVGGGMNSTASLDYVYVAASINGVAGGETPQSTDAGKYATASANGIRSLTGLNGGTITLGCQMRTNGGTWAASTSAIANMNAVIYFTR